VIGEIIGGEMEREKMDGEGMSAECLVYLNSRSGAHFG
jgi:hypothetical protein